MSQNKGMRKELDNIADLLRSKQAVQAHARLQTLLKKDPANPDTLHLMGLTLGELNRINEAIRYLEKAIRLNSRALVFQKNLGILLRQAGRLDDSRRVFAALLPRSPADTELCQYLAESSYDLEDAGFLGHLLKLIDSGKHQGEDQGRLHFATGIILDRQASHHAAMDHIIKANSAMARDDDHQGVKRYFSDIIFEYSASYLRKSLMRPSTGLRPVFIIGMPRSGTTLLEQILNSHPAFVGMGELPDINAIAAEIGNRLRDQGGYPACIHDMPGDMRHGFASAYVKRIMSLQEEGDRGLRPVDKNPFNFRYAGLILDLFPEARILHMQRDPRDVCVSCLFQNFTTGKNFSFNQESTGRFYLLYHRMMEHWQAGIPATNLRTVNYETLVARPRVEIGKILTWLEEDWMDSVLDFHQGENLVRTASASQVREPINTAAVARWKRYGDAIKPMLKILEPIIPTQ